MSGRLARFLEELKKVIIFGIPDCEVGIYDYSWSAFKKSDKFAFWRRNVHPFDPEAKLDREDVQYNLLVTTPKNPYTIFNNPLIDPYLSYTTSIHDTAQILGIEAARQLILDEVYTLYKDYGMNICNYHVQLLASFMTQTG